MIVKQVYGDFILKLKIFALILIIMIFSSCQKKEDNFLEDMASLDKAYMDTLLIIRDANNPNRKESIEKFIVVWNDFKKQYYNSNKEILNGKQILILCRIYLYDRIIIYQAAKMKAAGYSILA